MKNWSIKSSLEGAFEDRVREGKTEDKAEGIREMANRMLNQGLNVEVISVGTGLSIQKIKILKEKVVFKII